MNTLKESLKLLIIMTVMLGGIYPAIIFGISSAFFKDLSKGSLIKQDDKVIGSEILAQNFTKPGYFISRPSSAGSNGYDANDSAGSNLGPTNKAFIDKVQTKEKELRARFGSSNIPSDLVTSSASGLDPHISLNAAQYQISTIAKERNVEESVIADFVFLNTEYKLAGIIGEDRVNVLKLNIMLDEKLGKN